MVKEGLLAWPTMLAVWRFLHHLAMFMALAWSICGDSSSGNLPLHLGDALLHLLNWFRQQPVTSCSSGSALIATIRRLTELVNQYLTGLLVTTVFDTPATPRAARWIPGARSDGLVLITPAPARPADDLAAFAYWIEVGLLDDWR